MAWAFGYAAGLQMRCTVDGFDADLSGDRPDAGGA